MNEITGHTLRPRAPELRSSVDSTEAIARDVAADGRLPVVPRLLQILCDMTGMGFAAVARVTDGTWTACAVRDQIDFRLLPGGQLDLRSTLCFESRAAIAPIAINHASVDPKYREHHTPKIYKIESYVSVPIVLPDGRYFGNLCAIDPAPAEVANPKVMAVFEGLAEVIALQLANELDRERDELALRDAQARNELQEQFIAILGHDLRNPLQAVYVTGEVLERKLTDPALGKLAGRIKANARRMSWLIDDVCDFARGRLGGGIGVEIKPVTDLEPAIRRVVQEFQDGKPDRQIDLDIEIQGPVNCDEGRIQQLLSNLIGNALTHGDAVSPVKVSAYLAENHLVLQVSNRGEPIPEKALTRFSSRSGAILRRPIARVWG